MLPAPLPLSVKVIPVGNVPLTFKDMGAAPVVVTVNELAVLTMKLALTALVISGGCATLSVKLCAALGETPLAAVIVKL